MAKIALDAGHGLRTPGKQTPDGIKEWSLNDKIRDKVVELLSPYDVEIIHTDNDEGVYDESLDKRLTTYMNAGVDVFVSIHHNAFTGNWNGATGIEVYTDYNYTTEDQRLAQCIYDRLVRYTGLRGRGIKRLNFYVINQNAIPAVLVEGGFMDSTTDYKIITTDEGQTAYATAVAEGLIEFLKLKKKPVEVEDVKPSTKTQATSLIGMLNKDIIVKMGPIFTEDHKKSGILASVSFAQFILESGYGKSELAQKANNCFGMKEKLSGNTWEGSVWNGSIYPKVTSEYENGAYKKIIANFRKYPCIEDSVADHSAYLLGAMNGSRNRYAGLKGCKGHATALQIIKDGGYATSPTYVEDLLAVIDKWNLTKYDYKGEIVSEETPESKPIEDRTFYRVQTGSFKNKVYAEALFNKVRAAGYNPYMVKVDGLYKVQVGAFTNYGNAQALAAKLERDGFYTYISLKGGVAASTTNLKSIDEVAKEVISGKWGNGADRKVALTEAGYDYNAIQKRVNELL